MTNDQRLMTQLDLELSTASHLYHVMNVPTMADETYDQLFRQLVDLEKKHPDFKTHGGITSRVGNVVLSGHEKAKHKTEMLSLRNAFSLDEVYEELPCEDIESTNRSFYIANAKLDGLALSLIYLNGVFDKAVTRGDGAEGEDVTAAVRTILNVPKIIPVRAPRFEVRGECCLPKKAFLIMNEQLVAAGKKPYANARNAAAGIMRGFDIDEIAKRPLAFFAYGVVEWQSLAPGRDVELSDCLDRLKRFGFSIGMQQTFNLDNEKKVKEWMEFCIHFFTDLRDEYVVDIDGIVFAYDSMVKRERCPSTSNYPGYAVSYKFPASSATSIVEVVEWRVGRTGVITPVAHITPANIHGVVVSRVTLHNVAEIKRLNLMLNDQVIIERRGDVIPKIKETLLYLRAGNEEEIECPKVCPSCGNNTTLTDCGTFLFCCYSPCPAQLATRIEHFASRDAMNIKGFGIGIINAFIKARFLTCITDIYRLRDIHDQLIVLEGFGVASIDKLLLAIETSKKTELHRLLYGIGIPGVGENTSRNLAKHFNYDVRAITKSSHNLKDIADIGEITANAICVYFSDQSNLDQLSVLMDYVTWSNPNDVVVKSLSQWFAGQTWVVTGSFDLASRSQWEKILTERGAKISGSVSKNTTCLLAGSGTENGSKATLAKQLGVHQVSEKELGTQIQIAREDEDDGIFKTDAIGFFNL